MKAIKMAMIVALMAVTGLCSCLSKSGKINTSESSDSKSIVCYFSASGVTAKAAHRIADLTGFPVYEICRRLFIPMQTSIGATHFRAVLLKCVTSQFVRL